MLRARLLTAAALLAVFIAALFLLERALFAALIAVVVALGAHEWARLCKLPAPAAVVYAAAVGVLVAVLAWFPMGLGLALYTAAGVFWLILVPAWLASGVGQGNKPVLALAGFVVLVPAGLAAATLPPAIVLAVLGLVWLADSAAFFAGRRFGRHALAPAISPGKTWEGVAGAVLATLGYAIICETLLPVLGEKVQGAMWLWYLVASCVLCAASIVGDLFESALKRQAAAKDSGALLPGHGGVLDRIDSATATLPVAAVLLQWIPR